MNIFTLFGTSDFQMRDQKVFTSTLSELDALSLSSNSLRSWYPVLTEYEPVLHLGQIVISCCLVIYEGIASIFWASKGKKSFSISGTLQLPVSGSNNWETVAPAGKLPQGEANFIDKFPGSQ